MGFAERGGKYTEDGEEEDENARQSLGSVGE